MTLAKKSTGEGTTRDFGSPELGKRFTVVPRLASANSYHGKVVDDTEIDRLLLRDYITSAEHGMLVSLLAKLRKGSFTSIQSPDLNSSYQAADPSRSADRKSEAIRTVTRLMAELDDSIGAHKRTALINLVLLDTPWPFSLGALRKSVRVLQDIFAR